MRQWRGLIVAAVLLTSCQGKGGPAARNTPATPDPAATLAPLPDPLPEVVARVNGQAIPLRNARLIAEAAIHAGQFKAEEKARAYRQAVHQCVVRELLFQEAMARGLQADQKQIEAAADEARAPYKSEDQWRAFLAEQGMDSASFQQELRVQFTVNALTAQAAAKITAAEMTDELARKYYDEHPAEFETGERLQASHILIRTPPELTPGRKGEFKTKAEKLLAEIRTGGDFAALAKEHSEDIGSKGKGGALALFGKGQMDPAFEAAAYALQPGQVSDVVETPYGYHIIKLQERIPSSKLPFEAIRERLKPHILQKRRTEAVESLVNTLRSKAKIETYL